MRRILATTAVTATAVLALGACGSSDSTDSATASSTPAASSESAMESPSSSPSESAMEKDIVDTAVAAGDFKTLATALTAAGLVDTLKGPGPFTVFAPTDAAFAKLPAGTLDTLLADPQGKLAPILTYHVVSGKVMAADVASMNGQKVKTVNGASPDNRLVEIIEIKDHPWFVGVQFHPEFKSRPNRAHPIFREFVRAAIAKDQAK